MFSGKYITINRWVLPPLVIPHLTTRGGGKTQDFVGGYRKILRILDIGNVGFLNENRILCTKNVKIFRLRRYFERLFLF